MVWADSDSSGGDGDGRSGAEGRVILHADMDAFFAAVEQRDDPSLRGKPVVVGGGGGRGVVATASYEARRFGVRSAMPGAEARRRCPNAVFVAPRMEVYSAVSAQVREVFDSVTPLVEPLSLDEAFLDVTGSTKLFGDGPTIAARIRRGVLEATSLTISVGVAASKYVAKVASDFDKPDGLVVVPPGEEEEFLAPLSVGRLWGVGPVAQRRLHAAGLLHIGDAQRLGLVELQRRLGPRLGRHVHELSHGLDDRPVEPVREAKTVGSENTFPADLEDPEACLGALRRHVERVGARLRQQGLLAGSVRVKLRRGDFTTWGRQRRLAHPEHTDAGLLEVVQPLFESAWAEKGRPGLRLLGMTAADLVRVGEDGDEDGVAPEIGRGPVQGELFGAVADQGAAGEPSHREPMAPPTGSAAAANPAADPAERARLQAAIDAVRGKYGRGALRRADPTVLPEGMMEARDGSWGAASDGDGRSRGDSRGDADSGEDGTEARRTR